MAISKERKEKLVAKYKDLLARSQGLVLTSFTGLSVRDAEGLRGKVREVGGEFHVIKNRLARMAFEDAGIELPQDALIGTTAVGFAMEDVPSVAKAIVEIMKDKDLAGLRFKGGVVDGTVYGPEQVKRLAELPPLPVLRAQLLGVLQAPSSKLAGVLSGSVRQLVNVLNARAESESSA